MIGTQGDNHRGGPGKEIRYQSDAYEQRLADYLQTDIVKGATTKLALVAPLARRIRRHDFKLFMSNSQEMDILFGFDGGKIAELKSQIEITKVYIPHAMKLLGLLGHDTGLMESNMISRVEYLYDDMKVKSLSVIMQTFVKPVLLHSFALFADVDGWLLNDDYAGAKPDISALVKHDSVTQVVGYTDSRMRFRIRKAVEAYIECSKMGSVHGHMQTNQFEKGVQLAQQEASKASQNVSAAESRMTAQLARMQQTINSITPGGAMFSPPAGSPWAVPFQGFPPMPAQQQLGPPADGMQAGTPHPNAGGGGGGGANNGQARKNNRWGSPPASAGNQFQGAALQAALGGANQAPPLQAAQQAVDGAGSSTDTPRWMAGMQAMPNTGIRGLPKEFFIDYYDFQEKNPAISPINPGSLKPIRRCAFTDIADVAGYSAWKACCTRPRCTFKHKGELVRGRDGRPDIRVPDFPVATMQNFLLQHKVPQKPT